MESIFSPLSGGILFEVESVCTFVYGGETWSLHTTDICISLSIRICLRVCVCVLGGVSGSVSLKGGGPAVLLY